MSRNLKFVVAVLLLLTSVCSASPVARQGLIGGNGGIGSCKQELASCNSMPGAQCPQCNETTGIYLPMQASGSTGYRWCVNPVTGKEINGTSAAPGTPNPNCTCDGMKTAKNLLGTAIYCGPCYVNQTNNPACWGSIGGYCPQCADTGLFEPRQAQGGTGYQWCVNPTTGATINGTMTPPGQPAPVCTCDGMKAAANTDGQNAYCLLQGSTPPMVTSPGTSSSGKVFVSIFFLVCLLL